MSIQNVLLLACGSFNPLTIMHLRMFELARDYLHKKGDFKVIGGVISPVHDGYGKKGLAPAIHRLEMGRLGTINNPSIKISTWECLENSTWSETLTILRYHQNQINNFKEGISKKSDWMPETLSKDDPNPVRVKLLCGADMLESFNIPNLWKDFQVTEIMRDFGLVVITRNGQNPDVSIAKHPIMTQYKNNIFVVPEWILNDISSTKIRDALKVGDSVRYLVPDPVIEYINSQKLYKS